MIKRIGIEKKTFTKLRRKPVSIYTIPGETYSFEPWIEEALLETPDFIKINDFPKIELEEKEEKPKTKK